MIGNTDTAAVRAPDFRSEFAQCWSRLPNKGVFFGLLAAWLLMFQFLGNSSFGYVDTPSLMGWMSNAYIHETDSEEHGFLVPIVVLVLFWWKRKELLELPNSFWPPALAMLALAAFLHVLGYMAQQQRISIIGMFLGIYALMGLTWGPGWLRKSSFPFFLLVFCIPIATIATPVTFPMRLLVCKIIVGISPVLGIDVFRDGTQLYGPNHAYQYEVAAACSGMHSLLAILCLATIYGFVCFPENWKRLLMIASAFPLSILGNVARMMFIIMAAQVSGQSGGDYVHDSSVYSLIPYVPALGGLIYLGHLLRERPARSRPRLPLKPKTA